ncbi:MAG: hypothetical protein ACEQSC_00670 [Candidatus Nanopelagicaceae bacterium]
MIAPKRNSLPDGYVDLDTAAKMIALSSQADSILKIELHIDSTTLTVDQKASLISKILKAKCEIAFKGVE